MSVVTKILRQQAGPLEALSFKEAFEEKLEARIGRRVRVLKNRGNEQ